MATAFLLAGLGYGDEGKGTMTDYLVGEHNIHTVIRYNGGSQAAHNVVTPEGLHHTFAQLGSGTFHGARTFLSQYMLVDLFSLRAECLGFQKTAGKDPFELVTIDPLAPMITPYHLAANQLKEIDRGPKNHGSCGMGIGETMFDLIQHGRHGAPIIEDLRNKDLLIRKLREAQERKIEECKDLDVKFDPRAAHAQRVLQVSPAEFAEAYVGILDSFTMANDDYLRSLRTENLLFEGAQGVLLDQDWGFHPHTTWSNTTFMNADRLLRDIGYHETIRKMGITRSYSTRHGEGPLVTEDFAPKGLLAEEHNAFNEWQNAFRVGPLDCLSLRYALEVLDAVDEMAVTHMDKVELFNEVCVAYMVDGEKMSKIPFYPLVRLDHQEALGKQLMRATPVLMKQLVTPGFLSFFLSVPVTHVSWGRTRLEKSGVQ